MSFVTRSIRLPSTPPSALAKSRAIWTPAYSCVARGAWGPLSGKTAPTLMTLPPAAGAVPQDAVASNVMASSAFSART